MKTQALFFAVSALAAVQVRAQIDCSALPNPVYMQIGDTQEPLVKAIGKALRDLPANDLTLIYLKGSSCVNVDVFESAALLATNPSYIPSDAEDPTWTPASASPTCVIDPAGVPLDVANSATFISSCTIEPPPPGVTRVTGPVQAYGWMVPQGIGETVGNVITAEEAYFVYGFGAEGQITPWNDEVFIYKRPNTASTLLTTMANAGVPFQFTKGTSFDRSGQLLTALTTSLSPDKTIGIIGAEIADRNRATTDLLAFRAFGQRHAYFPDSTSESFDKKNVRDGHYVPWSPTEWMYYDDGAGQPLNPDAKRVVDLVLGRPDPDVDGLALGISVGVVPQCAMKVTRPFDGADLELFSPAEPCGCFFEDQVDVASASCVTCVDDSPCGGGVCRHGFCEEH